VASEFKGHVARLLTHQLAAVVLNEGFDRAWNAGQCWALYREVYGPEFVHFAPEDVSQRNLRALLAAHPGKRKAVLESLYYALTRQTDKALLTVPVVQRMLADYLMAAPPEQVRRQGAFRISYWFRCCLLYPADPCHAVRRQGPSAGPARVQGGRTSSGAAVSSTEILRLAPVGWWHFMHSLCVQYGTPKERRQLFRNLKGHFLDIACHDHGHMMLIVAMEVRDTPLVSTLVL
jgi:hypothetical protein